MAAGLTHKLRRLATEDVFDAKQVRSRQAREMFSDEQDQLKDILPNDSASYHAIQQKSEREKRDRDRTLGFNAAFNKAHPNFQSFIEKHFPQWEGSVVVEIGCCHIGLPTPFFDASLEAALVDMHPPAKSAFSEGEELKMRMPLFMNQEDDDGAKVKDRAITNSKAREDRTTIIMPDVAEASEQGVTGGGPMRTHSLVTFPNGEQSSCVVRPKKRANGSRGFRMSIGDMERQSVVARNGVPVTSVLVFEKMARNHTKHFLMSHQTDFQILVNPQLLCCLSFVWSTAGFCVQLGAVLGVPVRTTQPSSGPPTSAIAPRTSTMWSASPYIRCKCPGSSQFASWAAWIRAHASSRSLFCSKASISRPASCAPT